MINNEKLMRRDRLEVCKRAFWPSEVITSTFMRCVQVSCRCYTHPLSQTQWAVRKCHVRVTITLAYAGNYYSFTVFSTSWARHLGGLRHHRPRCACQPSWVTVRGCRCTSCLYCIALVVTLWFSVVTWLVSRVIHERVHGCWPNMTGMGKGWSSRCD